jgi:26S proteasome regulatory subunit N11
LKPKIVGAKEAEVREAKPPSCALEHPWSVGECKPKKGEVGALYLKVDAEERLRKHALAHIDEQLEVMGFLLGEARTWQGTQYALARQAVTTTLDATQVGVRFAREGLDLLARELDKVEYEYVIVGWYHSHPGYGCFLSPTDVQTQRAMFSQGYHVALVVDPVKEQLGAFKLGKDGYVPASFAVYVE